MICLRCGYCCIFLDVIIIDPKYVHEIVTSNNIHSSHLIHKRSNELCPHLEFNGDKATCKIHELKWFKNTPCARHTQIESKNSNCRMGEYITTDSEAAVAKVIKQMKEGSYEKPEKIYSR